MNSRDRVQTPEQALAYMTDCTLATVEDMASIKSRRKGEFKRQIRIAQQGVNWMIVMDIPAAGTRAEDVAKHRGSVEKWAEQFMSSAS